MKQTEPSGQDNSAGIWNKNQHSSSDNSKPPLPVEIFLQTFFFTKF